MPKKLPDWNKEELTYGEICDPAMEIEAEDEAKEFLDSYINWLVSKHGMNEIDAAQTAKSNLGYFSGYCGQETQERVERLFKCVHPVFGSVNGPKMSPEEVLELGHQMGERIKNGEGSDVLDVHEQPLNMPRKSTKGDFLELD